MTTTQVLDAHRRFSALALCFVCLNAFAQDELEYAADLEPFEVRALGGDYSPGEGKETITDVTPERWLTDDPGIVNLLGVVNAWSGGAKAMTGTKLWVHGGGHGDSANNGVYEYDFSGVDGPEGFKLLSISDVEDVQSIDQSPGDDDVKVRTYLDGEPASVHTYDGVIYSAHEDALYRFGGSSWQSGGPDINAWRFDLTSNSWAKVAKNPYFTGGTHRGYGFTNVIYDPLTRKLSVGFMGTQHTAFLDLQTQTWGNISTPSGNSPIYNGDPAMAYDTQRNRALYIGRGVFVTIALDFENEVAGAFVEQEARGATDLVKFTGLSLIYDEVTDAYWAFGGNRDFTVDGVLPGDAWENVYQIDADTFEIAKVPLTGDPINAASQWGSYGRYVFMSNARLIGLVANVDEPAYLIRLPGERIVIPRPEAPENLSISID